MLDKLQFLLGRKLDVEFSRSKVLENKNFKIKENSRGVIELQAIIDILLPTTSDIMYFSTLVYLISEEKLEGEIKLILDNSLKIVYSNTIAKKTFNQSLESFIDFSLKEIKTLGLFREKLKNSLNTKSKDRSNYSEDESDLTSFKNLLDNLSENDEDRS